MKRRLLLFIFVLFGLAVSAQNLELHYHDKSLDAVLLDLRERYELQFSFNHQQLSSYRITINQVVASPGEALDLLFQKFPLAWEKSGEVYLIFPKKRITVPRVYRFSGRASDRYTTESLPYAPVIINGKTILSDQNGSFAFRSTTDSLFHLQLAYLGYYPLDTVVSAGTNHQLLLTPALVRLQEIEVAGKSVIYREQIGQRSGEIRINHQVAGSLPGYGDNSVFNLLRLQPGILAAGEQSNDLIIRGSYEGQSQVLFDGFTLFNMKNFNDNISAVNPFMAKDIRVLKAGFPSAYGGRVGGLVEVTGVDGSRERWQAQLSVNNMTLNAWTSVPIAAKSALVLAFRQTYYELYDKNQMTFGTGSGAGRGSGGTVDRYVYPDYQFRDLNVRYSGETTQGDRYRLSFFHGHDDYTLGLEYENESQQNRLAYEDEEENSQFGASGSYTHLWKKGLQTEFLVAWSSLEKQVLNVRESAGNPGSGGSGGSGGNGNGNGNGGSTESTGADTDWSTDVNDFNQNKVAEFRAEIQNKLPLTQANQLSFGAGISQNTVHFYEDSFGENLGHEQHDLYRLTSYLENQFSPGKKVQLTAGIRVALVPDLDRLDWQPRFSGYWELLPAVRLTGSWGRYRQYLSRTTLIDELGNYRYLWAVANDESIPVQRSRQGSLGLGYAKNGLSLSVEAYQKKTQGLSRYVEGDASPGLYRGEAKARGIDVYARKNWKGHSFWAAYSLSEALEHFDYFSPGEYLPALHDQRHELKTAALINLKPVYLSANYVYGSGFPNQLVDETGDDWPYHRLDVAANYRFIRKHYSLELGFSILNVLNYENIKYANFVRIPDEQDASLNVAAEAVPFTPTLHLKLAF